MTFEQEQLFRLIEWMKEKYPNVITEYNAIYLDWLRTKEKED